MKNIFYIAVFVLLTFSTNLIKAQGACASYDGGDGYDIDYSTYNLNGYYSVYVSIEFDFVNVVGSGYVHAQIDTDWEQFYKYKGASGTTSYRFSSTLYEYTNHIDLFTLADLNGSGEVWSKIYADWLVVGI